MNTIHLLVGTATLVAFLSSGLYMRLHDPPVAALGEGPHVMFTSRHIYILAAALVHLVLGAYVAPAATRGRGTTQRVASGLLVAAAGLLVAAFIVEPVSGRGRTAASSFGLYALFAGSLLHLVSAPRPARRGTGAIRPDRAVELERN